MNIEYKNKYLKYKTKYLELLKLSGGGRYRDTGLAPQILTINDPYCKGVNMGDVDDWFSIIFLAQKFKENLHILIVDSIERASKKDYQYMVMFLKKTYGCNFYYDYDNQSIPFSHIDFKMCFISAPLPYHVFNYFKTALSLDKTIFFVQGGRAGYNAKLSKYYPPDSTDKLKDELFPNMFIWINVPEENIIFLESDQTNQAYNIRQLTNYIDNPICMNWNLYQVKKLFSVMHGHFLPYGFWFGPNTDNLWKGTGNSYTTMDIIMSSIDTEKFNEYKRQNKSKFSKKLTYAYHSYIKQLCMIKAKKEIDIINTKIQNLNKQKIYYSQEINILRGALMLNEDLSFIEIQENKLKEIYDEIIIPLAHYLINNGKSLNQTIIDKVENLLIDADTNKNKEIGDIDNFEVDKSILTQTPKLFDFNMSAFIIDMYDNKKLGDVKKAYKFQTEVNKYIAEQIAQGLQRNILILNDVLVKFKTDLEQFNKLPISDVFANKKIYSRL